VGRDPVADCPPAEKNARAVPRSAGPAFLLVTVDSVFRVNRTLGRDVYENIVLEGARRLEDALGTDQVGRLS
jgi:hypothetical protein